MIPLQYYYFYFTIATVLLFLPSLSIPNFTTPINLNITASTMPEKRNFSSYFLSSNQQPLMDVSNLSNNRKKLRRLPHVFNKVLELPFNSDADVFAQELNDCFEFVADVSEEFVADVGVKAHIVEIHPGITKVVIRRRDGVPFSQNVDELELDVWRYRLPASARAELATAVYAGGKLVVTVPKIGWGENHRKGGDCKGGGFKGNMGTPIFVQ